jgi:hypothetical protein
MKSAILRCALIGGAVLVIGGCTTSGYRHRGYGGVSYGYASPYYCWYDNYYYPGTGYYVYERSGKRHRWSDRQRRHWQSRHGDRNRHDNWSGYHRGHDRDDRHGWNRGGQRSDHRSSRDRRADHGSGDRHRGSHASKPGQHSADRTDHRHHR